MSAPKRIEGSPTNKLRIGILSMLASLPLFFILGVVRGLAVILFFAGLITYFDGLIQNRKWENTKKPPEATDSTKR